jgi:hypothetical protein
MPARFFFATEHAKTNVMTLAPPRLVPEKPFPPYAYVPGLFPHPTKDRRGHQFSTSPETDFSVENWENSKLYLFAIDLFNYGFYWEAHEAWESLWTALGRTGTGADFLKGLVKLAAAGVKVRESKIAGVQVHAKRAKELFELVHTTMGTETHYMGLVIADLIEFSAEIENDPPRFYLESGEKPAVAVVFSYFLFPGQEI